MGKRAGSLLPACSTACVEVDQRAKAVLCSIENVICNQGQMPEGLKSPAAKKQRCLELDQGQAPPPLDVSFLFAQARSVLRQPPSGSMEAPIGREQQAKQIDDGVHAFAASGTGKSMYVSGLPGTGKSHTVRKVLQQLLSSQPDATTITWVNCMSISSAAEVYAQAAASAAGSSNFQHPASLPSSSVSEVDMDSDILAAAGHAFSNSSSNSSGPSAGRSGVTTYQQLLDRLSKPAAVMQNPNRASASRPAPKAYRATRSSASKQAKAGTSSDQQGSDLAADVSSSPASAAAATAKTPAKRNSSGTSSTGSNSSKHIIVLDEIDNLAKKSTADLVQLFLLPHEPGVQVLLIGIANSIDLTERTLPELKLKCVSPTLVCFPAYTTKQLADILAACMKKLPCKLFEPSALELCARSVASSSGDLRHALKACTAAVDELERQEQQQQTKDVAPATSATPASSTAAALLASAGRSTAAVQPVVSVRYMMGALSRLAGVRSSQFGAQATSSIRSLPNQQQLLLYALSVLCRPRDTAAGDKDNTQKRYDHSSERGAAASSLWKAAGTAVALSSSGSGSGSGSGSKVKAGKRQGGGSEGRSQQVFVLSVGLEEAYAQYRQVCKLLALPPCSRPELQHMAELLAQMALVDVIRQTAAGCGAGGVFGSGSSSSGGAASGLKGLGGGRGGSKGPGGLGGLGGGRGLLGAGGLKVGKLGGAGAGQQQEVRLSLRPSAEEVEAALRHNPALRCLVQK